MNDPARAVAQLAVLGSPISHSRSPALHAAAYSVLGLDWSYGSHELVADGLEDFLASCDESWRGLSVTMPLKQRAFELAQESDRTAQLTGAVNTLRFLGRGGDRHLVGFNTDVEGIVRAVKAAGVSSVNMAEILGGGATAASALVAAAELGAEHISFVLRSPEKAAPLVSLARELGVRADSRSFSEHLNASTPDLVISTLPGGVVLPLEHPFAIMRSALLLDVAYAPWPSEIAAAWHGAGGRVINGLSMLVHQAIIQVRIFVAADPFLPLDDEDRVLRAMLDVVGLGADGLA